MAHTIYKSAEWNSIVYCKDIIQTLKESFDHALLFWQSDSESIENVQHIQSSAASFLFCIPLLNCSKMSAIILSKLKSAGKEY